MSVGTSTLKRIAKELRDLHGHPIREFCLETTEVNSLEIHFTLLGVEGSPYENGLYHGRITLPRDYPFAPPDIMLITPSGRFETNKKVCLSVSSYHPERWKPTWGISTVLHALRGFMLTSGNMGIGALNYSDAEKQRLARASRSFVCPECGAKVEEQWERIMKVSPCAADSETSAAKEFVAAASAEQESTEAVVTKKEVNSEKNINDEVSVVAATNEAPVETANEEAVSGQKRDILTGPSPSQQENLEQPLHREEEPLNPDRIKINIVDGKMEIELSIQLIDKWIFRVTALFLILLFRKFISAGLERISLM